MMLTLDHGASGAAAAVRSTIPSKVGELTVVARGATVVGVYFPGHWHRPDPASFGPCRDTAFDDAGGLTRKRFLLELEAEVVGRPGRLS